MKISFCTACMDRLFHLKETYAENIARAGSDDVEFVLLDYGGSDGLEAWVKENFNQVKFIRTSEPKYWVASLAKNIAHRFATGEILCNLDCDVIIPNDFVDYARNLLSDKKCVVAAEQTDEQGNYGCSGLIAVLRTHFYSVNGYDENINLGWGFESSNFLFRVMNKNSLSKFGVFGAKCLPHSDELRAARCQLKNISFTSDMSAKISDEMAESQKYVANFNRKWGSLSDIPPA